MTATRFVCGGALTIAVALAVPRSGSASCNLIPGTTKTFNSTLGATNRPYAGPGERLEIAVRSCDDDATGAPLTGDPLEHLVTVVFTPPNGAPRHAVVLTAQPDCAGVTPRLAKCESSLKGGTATCVAGPAAGLTIIDRDGIRSLSFRFPDTDGLIEDADDDRTLAGPATIAVTDALAPLPCTLAKDSCVAVPGLQACIDRFFADVGSCDSTVPHGVFPHFTALPPPNDFRAACIAEEPPCTAQALELRLTLDAGGNALLPFNWQGVLVRQGTIPVPRLVHGLLAVPVDVPGRSFLGSFTPEGGRLAPIFEPQSDPAALENVMTLFGSADAPYTVLRFARRSSGFQECAGGGNARLPCNDVDDCPGVAGAGRRRAAKARTRARRASPTSPARAANAGHRPSISPRCSWARAKAPRSCPGSAADFASTRRPRPATRRRRAGRTAPASPTRWKRRRPCPWTG